MSRRASGSAGSQLTAPGRGDLLPNFSLASALPVAPGVLQAPLDLLSASEQVVERLVTAIAWGSVLPGGKFPPEREMAARLRVSRATVRLAMHALEDQGYITIKRGRHGGAFVNTSWGPRSAEMIRRALLPRWQYLEWLFDLERGIAPLTARLAAERRSDADARELLAAARAYHGSPSSDAETLMSADHVVHSAIFRATGNPYYVKIENHIWSELSLGTDSLPSSEALRKQAVIEHDQLADAISAKNGELAAQLALQHFVGLVEEPLRALRERVLAEADAESATA